MKTAKLPLQTTEELNSNISIFVKHQKRHLTLVSRTENEEEFGKLLIFKKTKKLETQNGEGTNPPDDCA